MEITEVRVKLADNRSAKLKAFATVTIDDCFVIRDIKVIGGASGPFVAMPSRRLNARCPRCRSKNHLRAKYCNECGGRIPHRPEQLDDRGRAKLHADIAHPINQECRGILQRAILEAYETETQRSQRAGYEPPSEDYPEDAGPDHDLSESSQKLEEIPESPESQRKSSGESRMDGGMSAEGEMGIFG